MTLFSDKLLAGMAVKYGADPKKWKKFLRKQPGLRFDHQVQADNATLEIILIYKIDQVIIDRGSVDP